MWVTPHFFPDLLFIELEEQVKGSPEPNTYHNDSDDSDSQSGSNEYGIDSGILSDVDDAADQTPNPFYALVFTSFVPIGSFTAPNLDITHHILLGFLLFKHVFFQRFRWWCGQECPYIGPTTVPGWQQSGCS